MRVILVGSPAARARLARDVRAAGLDVVGEAATLGAARSLDLDADAFVLATSDPAPSHEPPFNADEPLTIETLTPREREILALLSEGLPNKAIAERLGISDQTVKFHVASIYGKLGATNRTDAVRRAVRRGLITL